MIRFDKSDRDVLAVCACGWRHHAAAGHLTASMASADAAAMQHLYVGHSVNELERRQALDAGTARERRRDTP
jgi:rhodanese-related sulfurtransferase